MLPDFTGNPFHFGKGPGTTERLHETSGALSLGCKVELKPQSVRWLRRKRRDTFQYTADGRLYRELGRWGRVWMRCENEKCFNPNHMELVSVWEMGRRYQKRVVTAAKERRKW